MSADRLFTLHQAAIHLAQEYSPRTVAIVHVHKGELTEPDEQNFRVTWSALSKDTPLEKSKLQIIIIPAQAQCMICRQTYSPHDKKIICPHCGSFGARILAGEELRLDHVETI